MDRYQHFAKTAESLGMGMCGAPVVLPDVDASNRCVGMVEGIVPASEHPLSDHAAFISSLDLLPLVEQAALELEKRPTAPDVDRDPFPAALLGQMGPRPGATRDAPEC